MRELGLPRREDEEERQVTGVAAGVAEVRRARRRWERMRIRSIFEKRATVLGPGRAMDEGGKKFCLNRTATT